MNLEELADAFQRIGSVTEANLDPIECHRLAVDLRRLANIAEHTGFAKSFRIGGAIQRATEHEADAERAYRSLPTSYRW